MEEDVKPGPLRRTSRVAVFFFTVVGFLASIVTVLSYFNTGGGGALHVKVMPNSFSTPVEVSSLIEDGSGGRRVVDELDASCRRDTPTNSQNPPPQQRTTTPSSQDLCSDINEALRAINWIRGYSGGGTYLQYEMENRGSDVARQIRVSSGNVASLQIRRGGSRYTNVEEDRSGEFYNIPDLNPHESISVLIWTTGSQYTPEGYWIKNDVPQVTFSGSSVNMRYYRLVPEFWYDVYDFLSDFPLVISIIIVLFACLIVAGTVIFVISLVDALVRGKPLSSIFKEKAKVEEEAPPPEPPQEA